VNDRWALNKRHWEITLDAHNVGADQATVDLNRLAALYNTADVRFAFDRLQPLSGATVLELGGGLGLAAILLARQGARVVIADLALPRLKAARENFRSLGLADRVDLVLARGEALPFPDGAVGRVMVKAVMIHTDLPVAMRELHRVLRQDGRMVILEPTTGNPFVNAYRRLLAPKVWAEIASFFGPAETAVLEQALPPGRRMRVHVFHFFSFFASFFEFALPSPPLYRFTEAVLGAVDRVLFTLIPPLRRAAWFNVYVIGPAGETGGRTSGAGAA
jgi:SAM-dependent methyltransferase